MDDTFLWKTEFKHMEKFPRFVWKTKFILHLVLLQGFLQSSIWQMWQGNGG